MIFIMVLKAISIHRKLLARGKEYSALAKVRVTPSSIK